MWRDGANSQVGALIVRRHVCDAPSVAHHQPAFRVSCAVVSLWGRKEKTKDKKKERKEERKAGWKDGKKKGRKDGKKEERMNE